MFTGNIYHTIYQFIVLSDPNSPFILILELSYSHTFFFSLTSGTCHGIKWDQKGQVQELLISVLVCFILPTSGGQKFKADLCIPRNPSQWLSKAMATSLWVFSRRSRSASLLVFFRRFTVQQISHHCMVWLIYDGKYDTLHSTKTEFYIIFCNIWIYLY